MIRELLLTRSPISPTPLPNPNLAEVGQCGAVVEFWGTVRGLEAGEPIAAIDYEAFEPMAIRQFHLLFDEIASTWPVHALRLIHRLGRVPVGEPSLWVEVHAPHRGEAFAACQHLIDRMKQVVPIWKRVEHAPSAAPPPAA